MFAIETRDDDGARQNARRAEKRRRGEAEGAGGDVSPVAAAARIARRHALLVGALGLVGLGIGAAAGLLTPNRYGATAQILIDPRDFRVLQNEVAPQAVGSDAAVAYLESQVRVMASDSVKRKVIDKFELAKDPDFGSPGGGLGARFGLSGASGKEVQDPVLVALAAMDKQVLIRRNERTYVIDVTVISGDGVKSARIANAMTEVYLEDQAAVRSEAAQRASNSLTSRLSELRERVRAAEDRVEKYRAANNLVGASGKLVTEETLAVSNTQLAQARARTADAQAKYDQVRIVRPSSIEAGATPEALQSQSIAAFRAQLGSALTREADAQVLYGAQHPQLISAQAQVRDARRQIAEELARIVQAARAELDRARASELAISQQVERLKRETLTTGQSAVQLRELEREADANRQVYQAFMLRARETSEQTGVDSTNARVITEATPPLEKLGPNRKLFALGGLMAGLGLGAGLAALRELMRGGRLPALGSASDAGRAAQPAAAPIAEERAAAPRPADGRVVPFGAAVRGAASGRWRSAGSAATPPAAKASGGPLRLTLPALKAGWRGAGRAPQNSAFHGSAFATDGWDAPQSALGRLAMQIRDRLAIEEEAGANRKTAVLALAPGAGASLVALNLTLATAREKATPLLIDLAGGPASLSAAFAPDADLGVESVIDGGCGLIRAALQDDETGAFFLPRPAGAPRRQAPTPTRIATGLFEQTRRFDAVVIDAGSVADGALPYLLAEQADDIVVVAPAGLGDEAVSRLIQRSLGDDAAKVRVIVANQGA